MKKILDHQLLPKAAKILAALVVINALLLCLFHYFFMRSLWLDEAFVAVNIKGATFSSFLGGLSYDQQFPRLYLALITGFTQVFGYELWSLRFFPLLFGLAGLVLGARVFWREYKNVHALLALTAILLFTGNHFIYYFAADLKQYSADLFFSLFAFWWAKEKLDPAWNEPAPAFAGKTLIWLLPSFFSLTYLFAAAAIGAAFWGRMIVLERGDRLKRAGGMVLITLFVAAGCYALDLRHTSSGNLASYWAGFFISGDTPAAFFISLWTGLSNILGRWWTEPTAMPLTLMALFGAGVSGFYVFTGKKNKSLSAAAFVLLLEMILLGILKRYPLEYGRTALFFFPFACALILETLVFFIQNRIVLFRWGGAFAAAGIFLLMFGYKLPINSRNNYQPWHWENLNPAFEEIESRGDIRVVYASGAEAQVKAAPHLPEQAEFVSYDNFMDRLGEKDWQFIPEKDFLFLMGVPTSQPDELVEALNRLKPADWPAFHRNDLLTHLFLIEKE